MKQLFSGKYYAETMRRMRMVGLIMLSICVFITAIGILIDYQIWRNMKESYPSEYLTYNPYTGLSETFSILSAFMFFGGFVLAKNAFGYLDKRSACDFFHAIPLKRSCLFNTTVAACMSWAALTILATALTGVLGCLITGMIFPYSNLLYCLPAYFIGTLLMCAIVTLAITLTGTGFSTFAVTMIILFLPRFILAVVNVGTLEFSQILSVQSLGFIFDASYNILVGTFLNGVYPLTSMTLDQMYMNGWVYLYSGVLAILYLVAGGFIFRIRKSETAGSSAPSRVLQHVYRCLVTLPFVLLATMLLILGVYYDTPMFIVLVAISLLVYFLYELITTKSVKKMLTSAPLYLAVILVSVLIVLGTRAVVSAEAARTLDVGEVKSISISTQPEPWNYPEDGVIYQEYRLEKMRFEDPEMIELAVNGLKYTVDIAQGRSNEYPSLDAARHSVNTSHCWIKYELKDGTSMIRQVYMKNSDYLDLQDCIYAAPEYGNAMRALPSNNEISLISVPGIRLDDSVKDSDLRRIWSVYKDEYSRLSDKDIAELNESASNAYIVIEGNIDGVKFISSHTLNIKYTPKTFNEVIRLTNSGRDWNKTADELDLAANSSDKDGFISLDMYVQLYGKVSENLSISDFYIGFENVNIAGDKVNMSAADRTQEFTDFIKKHARLAAPNDPSFMCITMDYYEETAKNGWASRNVIVYVAIDESFEDELAELINKAATGGYMSIGHIPEASADKNLSE